MPQRSRRLVRSIWLTLAILALIHQIAPSAQTPAKSAGTAMTLDVDATDAPMRILHATLSMAAHPGALTLFYPKWIPGEHMPSGPIANLTGLHVFADGNEIAWRRDLVEVNAFALTVPPGARTLTAKYDYVVPYAGGAFGTLPSTNAKIAVINWYTVGLYLMGESPATISVTASLKAPAGWKHGGSLDVASVDGNTIRYAPASLEMLNDHPVLVGEHFRSITLWPAGSAVGEHVIDVVADSEWALQFPQSRIDIYKKIVLEERAVIKSITLDLKCPWTTSEMSQIFSRSSLARSAGALPGAWSARVPFESNRFGRGPMIETRLMTISSRIGSIGGFVTWAKFCLK